MGAESGQQLAGIISRKELERRANGGLFLWGLGSPLGSSVRELAGRTAYPEVLFSPISGLPAQADVDPTTIILWLSYVSESGKIEPLPIGSFVTSRGETLGSARKASHYALFCFADEPLLIGQYGSINFGELKNLSTGKFVGYSQVTAIVEVSDDICATKNKIYPVALRARLISPYYVRLANPVVISKDEVANVEAVAAMSDPQAWIATVSEIKLRVRCETKEGAPRIGLFAEIH